MLVNNNNLSLVIQPCFNGIAAKTGLFVLMLTIFILLLPLAVQADGLFDFQMKLAKKGNAEAQYKVGEMYETGFGVEQDMKQARSWITKSANKGHETAGFKLLYWDVEKNKINKANQAKVDILIKKAKEGNAQAQYYVGKMHAHGVGVKKDPDTAIGWLNKAAFVGVLEAERELTVVREEKQRNALTKQRREEKKQAELKQQREKQLELEKQQKLQVQKKANSKSRADEAKKQKKAAANARAAADAEAARKARLLAKKEAEKKQREAQKQALLKKRKVKKKQRKQQFESDPCSGKSARFLSTCK